MIRQRPNSIPINLDSRDSCAVSYFKGSKHRYYEDRFRLLTANISLVRQRDAGQLYVVADGVGSAPRGANAAQHLCSRIDDFYRGPDCSLAALQALLLDINAEIFSWGYIENSDRPTGACAASIAWIIDHQMHVLHSGDTCVWLHREGTCKTLTRSHTSTDGCLARYFGQPAMECELHTLPLRDGDQILMSSDGILSAGVSNFLLAELCNREAEPERIARAVAEYAYSRTQDDVTFLCIDPMA